MARKDFSKRVIVVVTTTLLFGSLLASLYVSRSSCAGVLEDSSFWLDVASNAWDYFQPGVGVDSSTGLPLSNIGYTSFTDWDLGLYIQAIVGASELGLLKNDGAWGVEDRTDKVLSFLENRPLMSDGGPYLFYSSQTMQNVDDRAQVATDAGNLFVSLQNLAKYNTNLAPRIGNIVFNRTNYEREKKAVDVLLPETLNGYRIKDIYDYYVICSFAGYWPQRFSAEADRILDFIVSNSTINYNGLILPKAKLTSEPLLLYIFNFNKLNATMLNLAHQIYLAQEQRYNTTGKFTAFSEGACNNNGLFIYEWVVYPDGRMWVLQTSDVNDLYYDLDMPSVAFFKVALGFLAVYNTSYAQKMVSRMLISLPVPTSGYTNGLDGNGEVNLSFLGVGNSLIISAARYGAANNVSVPLSVPKAKPASNQTLSSTPWHYSTIPSPTASSKSQKPEVEPVPSEEPAIVINTPDTLAGYSLDSYGFSQLALVIVIMVVVMVSAVAGFKRNKIAKYFENK